MKKKTAALERGGQLSADQVPSAPYTAKRHQSLALGKPVRVCADFEPIKARALDLLKNNLSSFTRSFTLEEMLCDFDDHSWAIRNSVGVALCKARDEIKSKCFKVGLHERATKQIVRQLEKRRAEAKLKNEPPPGLSKRTGVALTV